ncbi:hypothetical protein AD939_10295 [Gluconobacter oxydans]|nr:hypothetical protein AD939_10295 [Gluconobacter oxydans]
MRKTDLDIRGDDALRGSHGNGTLRQTCEQCIAVVFERLVDFRIIRIDVNPLLPGSRFTNFHMDFFVVADIHFNMSCRAPVTALLIEQRLLLVMTGDLFIIVGHL